MELPYTKCEAANRVVCYQPRVPLILRHKGKPFKTDPLIDTGSDMSIMSAEVAKDLDIQLDDSKRILLNHAGGGTFIALPSRERIEHAIEVKGFRPIRWKSTIYFADVEGVALLGHHDCLEKFILTFYGPSRKLTLEPQFPVS